MGAERIAAMVAAFYRRVPGDGLLGPMYPADDLEGAEKRLRDFLVFRLGGPQTYLEERGHPRLRMRHLPFSIGAEERDRWLQLMDAAMDEAGVEPEHIAILRPFFAQIADFMRNR
jgi:hemoglobin